jgi:regulator of sigma D
MPDIATHKYQDSYLDDAIRSFITNRMNLLGLLQQVPELFTDDKLTDRAVREKICGALVDYVSMGHFELYEKLLNTSAKDLHNARSLAQGLFPLMLRGTERVLMFNDVYTNSETDNIRPLNFAISLYEIGDVLAQRFAAEDQILKSILH